MVMDMHCRPHCVHNSATATIQLLQFATLWPARQRLVSVPCQPAGPWMTEMDLPSLQLQLCSHLLNLEAAEWHLMYLYVTLTLTWWPSYMNLTWPLWRCTRISKMNTLGQGCRKLSYYRRTDATENIPCGKVISYANHCKLIWLIWVSHYTTAYLCTILAKHFTIFARCVRYVYITLRVCNGPKHWEGKLYLHSPGVSTSTTGALFSQSYVN